MNLKLDEQDLFFDIIVQSKNTEEVCKSIVPMYLDRH
jgi:hypothetical protein